MEDMEAKEIEKPFRRIRMTKQDLNDKISN